MNNIKVVSSGYDGRRLELTCTQEMDIPNNRSKINWTLTAVGGVEGYAYSTGPTTVTINGTKVWYKERLSYTTRVFPTIKGSTSGSIYVPHNADGTKTISVSVSTAIYYADVKTSSSTWTLDALPRGAYITGDTNFSDDEMPTITYSNPLGDKVTSIQACISLTGKKDDIPYRDISKTGTSYTFFLTDEELNTLYANTNDGKPSRTVYFYIKTVVDGYTYYNHTSAKTFTITDCEPTLELTQFKETDEAIINGRFQEGEEFPAYFYDISDIAYTLTPTLKKGATLKECFFGIDAYNESRKLISGNYATTLSGTITDIKGYYYEAYIIDSRGHKVELFDRFPLVPYVIPTINMDANIDVLEETVAVATLRVNGALYIGSMGNSDNTFRIDYRYKENGGEWSAWIFGTDTAHFGYDDENYVDTYSAEIVIDDLNYQNSYEFQTRVVDSLKAIESHNSKVLSITPLFDWSNEDFNFNVPVNMNNKQVLRLNNTGRLIISASDGIYLRPNGTDNEEGQVIISPDGGGIGASAADYIIETGTTSMGSNGTWYWSKWKSGKAECYGLRNYGNMGVSTAWGQLFESSTFTQTLPGDLFSSAPQVVDISIQKSNLGAWIEKKGTNVSADSTGEFFVVRATSGTLSQVHLSFNIIGRWD